MKYNIDYENIKSGIEELLKNASNKIITDLEKINNLENNKNNVEGLREAIPIIEKTEHIINTYLMPITLLVENNSNIHSYRSEAFKACDVLPVLKDCSLRLATPHSVELGAGLPFSNF
jgi:hypothetical protein